MAGAAFQYARDRGFTHTVQTHDQLECSSGCEQPVVLLGFAGRLFGLDVDVQRAVSFVLEVRAVTEGVEFQRVGDEEPICFIHRQRPERLHGHREVARGEMRHVARGGAVEGKALTVSLREPPAPYRIPMPRYTRSPSSSDQPAASPRPRSSAEAQPSSRSEIPSVRSALPIAQRPKSKPSIAP